MVSKLCLKGERKSVLPSAFASILAPLQQTPSRYQCVSQPASLWAIHSNYSYWLNLEMKRNQREDQCLQVLYQVVEDPQALWVFRLVDIDE
jgi:hypothetical protein